MASKRKLPSWTQSVTQNFSPPPAKNELERDEAAVKRKSKEADTGSRRKHPSSGTEDSSPPAIKESEHDGSAAKKKSKEGSRSKNASPGTAFLSDNLHKASVSRGESSKKSSVSRGESSKKSSFHEEITSKEYESQFSRILEGVVFAISGMVNPERAELREKALEMGAVYRPDWSDDCTLLVCAFPNTPKFKAVVAEGGSIVSKEWILECHRKKQLVDIDGYLLFSGKPWKKGGKRHIMQVSRFQKDEIKKWINDDKESCVAWLQNQEEKPNEEEMRLVASQGLLVCFEDVIKCLKEHKGIETVLNSWAFIPRGVEELAKYDEELKLKGADTDILAQAQVLRDEYLSELKISDAGNLDGKNDVNGGLMEKMAAADESTEVISGSDSGDEINSSTQVVDFNTIENAKTALLNKFFCNTNFGTWDLQMFPTN